MFELLRALKADPSLKDIPVVCVRLVGSNLAPTLVQSLKIACEAVGAETFIDLYSLERKVGADSAPEELAQSILAVATKRPTAYSSQAR